MHVTVSAIVGLFVGGLYYKVSQGRYRQRVKADPPLPFAGRLDDRRLPVKDRLPLLPWLLTGLLFPFRPLQLQQRQAPVPSRAREQLLLALLVVLVSRRAGEYRSLSPLRGKLSLSRLFIGYHPPPYPSDHHRLLHCLVSALIHRRAPSRLEISLTRLACSWMVGLAHSAAHFFKFLLVLVLFNIATTMWNVSLLSFFLHSQRTADPRPNSSSLPPSFRIPGSPSSSLR